MKAVFIGDLQAHAWSQYSRTLIDGMNDRLMDVVTELQRVLTFAFEHKVKVVFILGDVFQERGKLDTMVLNSVYRMIEQFRAAGMRVVLLLGNHDRTPVGEFHSLEVFRGIADVVDEPREMQIAGATVLAIPFLAEAKHTSGWLKSIGSRADLIIMHTAVKGVTLPSGEAWGDGVPLSDIPEEKWTFMGHFHKWTKLRERCYYVGSFLQLNWGEAKDEKVFGYFRDGKISWIPTQGPRFIDVTVEDFNTRTDLKDNFVRVHYHGPVDEAGAVRSYLLDTVGARAVELVFPPHVAMETIKNLDDPRVLDLVSSYVQGAPIADRSNLLDTGRAILQKAEALEDQSEET
jgi:DNA repair exonuclease SbcCD nuclease subunit